MTTNRVSLLTTTTLSKVYSSSDSIKTINLLRNLSFATQRSSEFQDLNGYQTDQYSQKPNEVYSESLNPRRLQQKTDGESLNPNEVSKHSPNLLKTPVGQNGTSASICEYNSYGQRFRSDNQNDTPLPNENTSGYDGQTNKDLQHYPTDRYTRNAGNYQHSLSSGQNQQSFGRYQQSSNIGQGEQNPGTGQYQQNSTTGQYQQNSTTGQYHLGNAQQFSNSGQYQPMSNVGQYQQNQNVAQYQQSPSLAQYQQNQNGGQYQQSPTLTQYHQNHNFQPALNGTVASDAKQGAESGSSTYQATIEELDCFCTEGNVKEAVEVLELLEKKGIVLDLSRFMQLMQACGDAKALEEAKTVHQHIVRSFSPIEVSTYNKILETYSRCGSMDDAINVFRKMPVRNLTSWDTMITWLAKNGLGEDAIDLFTEFKKAGLKPDSEMFIGVFSACSVVGDINEGKLHFETMNKEFAISPTMKHYVSIVDMLGCTGHLDEALEFIENMPVEPSVDVWETLMNNCRVHGFPELGDRCVEIIEKLDPSRLNEESKAGFLPVKPSDNKESKKPATRNPLEIRSRVREYRAGDTSHPDSDKTYTILRGMREQMKEAGYIPETRFVLHDIDQEGKEDALLAHSERLAVVHGLLSSSARSPIRIMKNLRVCGDCHTALKIIAKIVGRELIIRDAKRFHHFKDGLCSCRDYW